jgi:hypothetical protein
MRRGISFRVPVISRQGHGFVQRRENIAGYIRIGVFIDGNRGGCMGCIDKRNVLLSKKIIPFILKGEVTALNNFSVKKASVANR